jgi:hypothetical protein
LIWIGLLYALLGLGSYFYFLSGDDIHFITPKTLVSPQETINLYRDRTVQCLATENYLKPNRFTVQALLFLCVLECFQSRDATLGVWVTLGSVLRVAMRLGYHRDPIHYPGMSVFHGEMRRRTWTIIQHLDLLTASQVGLPRMVKENETDTAEPSNLLDSDFDESTTELPTPRPSNDATPLTYATHKTKLLTVLGAVIDETNSLKQSTYDAVMFLESRLQTAYNSIPPGLKPGSLLSSINDHPDTILRRLVLESCFHKGRCVLHRKYLIPAFSDNQYAYSRRSCVDAAMRLLKIQTELHDLSLPGGLLFRDRWKMGSPVNNDFLLAAMVLCLDLDWKTNKSNSRNLKDQGDEVEALWPRDVRLESLKRSYNIWCASSKTSTLSTKAAESLKIMLQKLETKTRNSDELGVKVAAPWPTPESGGSEPIIQSGQ